ncbi:MAG: extracellular solute-binding protein [Verrucomicrobia bacterium]|nr:extracellular solute-binding protein [Verrucomicrobiota bacterium]
MLRRNFLRLTAGATGTAILGGMLGVRSVASAAAKPQKLNLLYATAEADSEAIKLILPDFASKLGVKLNLETFPYAALQQKVFAELASSSSFYDIMIVDTPWMPALTNKIEPLIAYLKNPQMNDVADPKVSDFIPAVFYDASVYNPKKPSVHYRGSSSQVDVAEIEKQGFEIYGLPLQANVLTMAYRKDLFNNPEEQQAFQSKYGKPLSVPETWDDFVPVAEFFTRPEKRLYGTTLMAGSGDWAVDDFKTLLACWGGDGHLITDDLKLSFASPEGAGALSFYADLINKQKVTPPGVTSFSWDDVADTFNSGLTAMAMNYHDMKLNSGVKGEVAYAMVPKKVAYGPHFGTWILSVNKFSKNKEWAYRAVAWLTSAETQTKMLEKQLHPSRVSVYKEAVANSSLQKDFANFYDILGKSLAVGVGRARLSNYFDVSKVIAVAVNNAATGSQKPQAALDAAVSQIKDMLKQAGYSVADS